MYLCASDEDKLSDICNPCQEVDNLTSNCYFQ